MTKFNMHRFREGGNLDDALVAPEATANCKQRELVNYKSPEDPDSGETTFSRQQTCGGASDVRRPPQSIDRVCDGSPRREELLKSTWRLAVPLHM
jgi:hypothetical protein